MKKNIETYQKFVFRLEDFIYLFCGIYTFPVVFATYHITTYGQFKNSAAVVTTIVIFTCLIIQASFIYFSYRKRLQDTYYIEDEVIIRERNGREIFRIPYSEIVSVRVYNRKGIRGSILFFTDQASKNYSYHPLSNLTPISLYGFTRKKINLVKDRKKLLTEIYQVNPKLHFIE